MASIFNFTPEEMKDINVYDCRNFVKEALRQNQRAAETKKRSYDESLDTESKEDSDIDDEEDCLITGMYIPGPPPAKKQKIQTKSISTQTQFTWLTKLKKRAPQPNVRVFRVTGFDMFDACIRGVYKNFDDNINFGNGCFISFQFDSGRSAILEQIMNSNIPLNEDLKTPEMKWKEQLPKFDQIGCIDLILANGKRCKISPFAIDSFFEDANKFDKELAMGDFRQIVDCMVELLTTNNNYNTNVIDTNSNDNSNMLNAVQAHQEIEKLMRDLQDEQLFLNSNKLLDRNRSKFYFNYAYIASMCKMELNRYGCSFEEWNIIMSLYDFFRKCGLDELEVKLTKREKGHFWYKLIRMMARYRMAHASMRMMKKIVERMVQIKSAWGNWNMDEKHLFRHCLDEVML